LTLTVAFMGTAVKHPMPDRVKQSWASECPDVKNYKWRLNPFWHRILDWCTLMATEPQLASKG